jgi:ATP-dependent Lon protease
VNALAVYPLLPLRGVLVFPELVVPLEVGREKSVRAMEAAMAADRRLVFVSQRDVRRDNPGPDDLYRVGTVAQIQQLVRLPSGAVKVVVEGIQRARVLSLEAEEPYFRADVEEVPEPPVEGLDEETQAWVLAVVHLYEEYMKLSRKMPPDTLVTISADDPARLCDAIATHLDLRTEEKERVLEAFDLGERLRVVHAILSHQHRILSLEREIQGRVRQEIDEGQREFWLRAQLKAIREELGEGEDEEEDEAAAYRRRVAEADLPDEVRERAEREVTRLGTMPATSPEAVVSRTYLDWLLALPWRRESEDRLDLEEAERLLDRDHDGLRQVKDRILEALAVRQLRPDGKSPILCLVGPPGVGKTSLGRTIAEALGRRFVRLSLGGVHDEAEIRGHRRTYVGAMPGRILQGMRQAGTRNPVFLLDEVDKLGRDVRGDPSSALLEVLDPEQNRTFSDHYVEVPFDLSHVLFLTTANTTHTIPPALLDRMEVVHLPGYSEEEKVRIARRHLLPRQVREHGLEAGDVRLSDAALRHIILAYTREAGVRQLERAIAALCRKAARRKMRGQALPLRVVRPGLRALLGPPLARPARREERDQVGVSTAVWVSEYGADTMPVEVALAPGRGRLSLTGQLGEVMRESARAALTYARAHAVALGIDPGAFARTDVHVHVPDGATPKEGPSAGVAILVALVSAFTGRPVRADVAMTGEVTLRGRVLPIGGLKAKALAAHRNGYRLFYYPADNADELEEVGRTVGRAMSLVPVRGVDEVLTGSLLPAAPEAHAAPPARQRARRRRLVPEAHPHVIEGPS